MFSMTSKEVRDIPPQHFGISLETLTDDILWAVIGIYYEVAKESTIDELSLECSYSADEVRDTGGTEYRLGSVLNPHSKLYITREGLDDVVQFSFYANHQVQADEFPESPNWHIAKRIQDTFAERVDELLIAIGAAEPVS